MNHVAIIEDALPPQSANGVTGILIRTHNQNYVFRVYDANHNFKDYDIAHSDLQITIDDPDAYFYMDSVLDHSPATLGL